MLVNIYEDMINQTKLLGKSVSIFPTVIEFHPSFGFCNLKCLWCIGQLNESNEYLQMDFNAIKYFMQTAYQPNMANFWPKEIHFCGNNSDPLLNYKFVNELCDFIREKSVIEIITNGILMNRISKSLPYIDKISISLDVFNEKDFVQLKGGTQRQFNDILKNIQYIVSLRSQKQNNTLIYVTFVLDYPPENYNEAYNFIHSLKNLGVNHIQFRSNYLNNERNNIYLLDFVRKLCIDFSTPETVDYTKYDPNIFYIKYNEYKINKQNCTNCYMMNFWPIIVPQYIVFPCAHVANINNIDMGRMLDVNMDYYGFWNDKIYNSIFKCHSQHLCPSMANSINALCNQRE